MPDIFPFKLDSVFKIIVRWRTRHNQNMILHFVFLMELFCLIYVPVQDLPLPVYPGLQVQRYEPIVLLHCAFTWQAEGKEMHSLISAASVNISIKSSMRNWLFSQHITESIRKRLATERTNKEVEGRAESKLFFSKCPIGRTRLLLLGITWECFPIYSQKNWFQYFGLWDAQEKERQLAF